jgi:Fe-S-cluster-containing dehydrogenase component
MDPSSENKVLFVDFEKCTGCRTCEVACSLKNERICNPAASRITVINWEEMGIDVPMVCQQCENPPCKAVCPVEAIFRNEETGILSVDHDVCIGCRSCLTACPFGALVVHPQTGKVMRCTLCDGDPTCVKYCETKALQYVVPSKFVYLKKKASAARLSELLAKLRLD